MFYWGRIAEWELDSSGSGSKRVKGCCKHVTETSFFVNRGKFPWLFEQLSLFVTGFAAWIQIQWKTGWVPELGWTWWTRKSLPLCCIAFRFTGRQPCSPDWLIWPVRCCFWGKLELCTFPYYTALLLQASCAVLLLLSVVMGSRSTQHSALYWT